MTVYQGRSGVLYYGMTTSTSAADVYGETDLVAPPETSGAAVAALVLAVMLAPLLLVGPGVAWALASRADSDVALEGMRGGELARAARSVALAVLVLQAVAVLAVAYLVWRVES